MSRGSRRGAWALIPVKDSLLAKTRLAAMLNSEERACLQRAMLADVVAALGQARLVERIAIIGPHAPTDGVCSLAGIELVREDRTPDDLNRSIANGVDEIRARGAKVIAVIPCDVPLIDPEEIDAAIGQAKGSGGVVVVPDRHGKGTNAMIFSASCPPEFAFGPGSLQRHLESAAGPVRTLLPLPSLGLDIDTPEDLRLLMAAEKKARAPATRQMMERLPEHTPVRETGR